MVNHKKLKEYVTFGVIFLLTLIVTIYFKNEFPRIYAAFLKTDIITMIGVGVGVTGLAVAFYQAYLQINATKGDEEEKIYSVLRKEDEKLVKWFENKFDDLETRFINIDNRVTNCFIEINSHAKLPGHKLLLEEIIGINHDLSVIKANVEHLTKLMQFQEKLSLMEVLVKRLSEPPDADKV